MTKPAIKIRFGNSLTGVALCSCALKRKWLILIGKMIIRVAGVAQSVEQLICNQQVAGSSPIASSSLSFVIGGVPERPKGADCKSAGGAYGGSNPPPSTMDFEAGISGSSSVARASAFQAEGRGFESRFPLQVLKNKGADALKITPT